MQLVNIEVLREGATPVVTFRGEGGEKIAVTFAPGPALPDENLVAKAKATLVQVATFSNELDEDAGTALTEKEAPQQSYTLEYQDKGEVRLVTGLSFPSLDLVQEECRRSAKDLWDDALSRGEAPVGWAVRARSQDGTVVASVDYEQLQHAAPGAGEGVKS
ncbi:hypothetical protein [Mesorhizobium sp. WSM3876]|uniref:DUF6894 family protein n=1 Tax=Mesorhizobium sp. WSM3876 TaxID=422277 RepID=UPI000BB077E9|nr:hypothetical protein [Mesorhizobium sp. WSM3876]PBB83322.1 hypothetical protein CK216_29575 [Mesorhizobium sp. WSM3876]TGT53261.1 hypothetical protein EN813_048905 [Mesorhizobium sp. M00.F.Ca.ET.170.01.1.1]